MMRQAGGWWVVRVLSGDMDIPNSSRMIDKAPSCKYLKDDCLYFSIEVQAAKPLKPCLTGT